MKLSRLRTELVAAVNFLVLLLSLQGALANTPGASCGPQSLDSFVAREQAREVASTRVPATSTTRREFSNPSRYDDFSDSAYQGTTLRTANNYRDHTDITFDARHTFTGTLRDEAGENGGRLINGMHTRHGLENFIENRPQLRGRYLDESGNIQPRFIDVDTNTGVQAVIVPVGDLQKGGDQFREARRFNRAITVDEERYVLKTLFPPSWGPDDIESAARATFRNRRADIDDFFRANPTTNTRTFDYTLPDSGVTVAIQIRRAEDGNLYIGSAFPSWDEAFEGYNRVTIPPRN